MAGWEIENETNAVLVTRAEAIEQIKTKARNDGYTKCRVKYNGSEVSANELPEMVDMSKVEISAMLNNA